MKEKTNKANSYLVSDNTKEVEISKNHKIISDEESKLPLIKNDSLTKKTNEMVSVASLLAEKKKISRKNICENINSENLLNQAKRKLQRNNPSENIERFSKMK